MFKDIKDGWAVLSPREHHELLKLRIVELSESKNWEEARLEWREVYYYYRKVNSCLCKHYIHHNFEIHNFKNDELTIVGSECIKYFQNPILTENAKIAKRDYDEKQDPKKKEKRLKKEKKDERLRLLEEERLKEIEEKKEQTRLLEEKRRIWLIQLEKSKREKEERLRQLSLKNFEEDFGKLNKEEEEINIKINKFYKQVLTGLKINLDKVNLEMSYNDEIFISFKDEKDERIICGIVKKFEEQYKKDGEKFYSVIKGDVREKIKVKEHNIGENKEYVVLKFRSSYKNGITLKLYD